MKRARLGQSQRDCGPQPRVARNELPWETCPQWPQPQRGYGMSINNVTQPLRGWRLFVPSSQGSSFLATLGFGTESRWDSPLNL